MLHIYLKSPHVRAWLTRCFNTGFAHGEELSEGGPNTSDWGATSDRILSLLEKEGWIVRSTRCPSLNQRFLGVGGQSLRLSQPVESYARCWGWMPNRDSADASEYLGYLPSFVQDLRQGKTYAELSRRGRS